MPLLAVASYLVGAKRSFFSCSCSFLLLKVIFISALAFLSVSDQALTVKVPDLSGCFNQQWLLNVSVRK